MRLENRNNGFTLMEIMIAVSIIGLLLAIAIPAVSKSREQARIQKAKSDLELIAAAVRQLAWDTGKWPGALARNVTQTAEIWDLNQSSSGLLTANTNYPNWNGPYIERIPLDPWGKPYFFDPDYYISGQIKVVVGSFGPNRVGPNLYDRDDIIVILK